MKNFRLRKKPGYGRGDRVCNALKKKKKGGGKSRPDKRERAGVDPLIRGGQKKENLPILAHKNDG